MKYRRLGRTARCVSELCLGTMNFGPLTTQTDSFVIMDRARTRHQLLRHRQPLRRRQGPGATETIVGKWFAQGGGGARRSCCAKGVPDR
jgi:aryl-alcohol dehydrogenase-like predicted oxidoreductase